MPKITGLDHLVLTVADLDATIAFYTHVLGMRAATFQIPDGTVRHALCFGDQKINLHRQGHEFAPNAALATPGSADLCFLSETPLEEWQRAFAAQGIAIVEGPVERSGATGPIRSLYVRDPDGNLIELSNRV